MTDQGTLIHLDGRPTLRFERRYAHSVDRVWRAISDPGEMASWFPSDVEGDRAVGADLAFVDDAHRAAARQGGEPTRDEGPITRGRVVAYDPPKVFSFTWGGELLRYELTPHGSDTVLVFTQVLSHQSIAARNGSGWQMCLDSLDALLDEAAPPDRDDWREVYEDYLLRMGPELGTPIGDGGLIWERSTHVDPDRVGTVTTDATEIEAWGAGDHADEPIHWQVEPAASGTLYRLTHDRIGDDATLAATWHALLIQLDMYLAAGQLVPVEPKPWIDAYANRLG
jgi:uncharacterized protein YndB with AHSA1/START domain